MHTSPELEKGNLLPAGTETLMEPNRFTQETHSLESHHDKKSDKRLTMKIDLAIIPMTSLLYLFCFIDRANIGKSSIVPNGPPTTTDIIPGNAKIAGIEHDLGLQGYDFNIALTCFAVTYALCEIPAALCCKLIGPGWFIPGCTVAFGLAATATGLVQTRTQLFVVRCLLGMFESGLFPGIAYYMSRWYRRAELGFRLSFYVATAALAGAFGGLLASAILNLPEFGRLRGWRMIFIIEGIITVGIGGLGFLLLTDRPETARWLTLAERKLAVNRVVAERVATEELLDKIDTMKLKRGLTNPVALGTAALFFMNTFTVQGLAFFLPTILANIYPSASVQQQQLYTVAPYLIGAFLTLTMSGISWWLDRRQTIMILAAIPVLVSYAMFLSTMNAHVRYAAAFLVASTSFVPGALGSAQVSANVVCDTSRSIAIGFNVFVAAFGVSQLLLYCIRRVSPKD